MKSSELFILGWQPSTKLKMNNSAICRSSPSDDRQGAEMKLQKGSDATWCYRLKVYCKVVTEIRATDI